MFGIGVVMVLYALVAGAWRAARGRLDLTAGQRIGIPIAVGAVLVATNTVVPTSVGLVQFFVGLILLIYGCGLGISHVTD